MCVPLDLPKTNLSRYVPLTQRPHSVGESVMGLGMLLETIPVTPSVPKFCWLHLVATKPCYIPV